MSEAPTHKVAAILAAYWWSHPAACDTPEGIRHWWLGAGTDITLAEVEEALRWMMEQGFIEQRLTGGRSLFRFRADADPVAMRSLASQTGTPDP